MRPTATDKITLYKGKHQQMSTCLNFSQDNANSLHVCAEKMTGNKSTE